MCGQRLLKAIGSTEASIELLNYLKSESLRTRNLSELSGTLRRLVPEIMSLRPSSAFLENTLRELLIMLTERKVKDVEEGKECVAKFIDEVINRAKRISNEVAIIGSKRIADEDVILTHSYSTTVINLLLRAKNEGKRIHVYVTESRPGGEGLTTAEILSKNGIPVTLIVDSAVRYVMKDIDKVIVGAEAIAVNGAVVNKVGTSALALIAKEARVRVYVASGTYKFKPETVFGELVRGTIITEPNEVLPPQADEELKRRIKVLAPLFDVTPPEYIDAIITEKGLIAPQAVPILIREIFSWPPQVPSLDELLKKLGEMYG